MKKWNRIYRDGVGRFGYEIYEDTTSDRFLIKIYIYDAEVKLSGDYDTISRKLSEVKRIFNNLQKVFPEEKDHL